MGAVAVISKTGVRLMPTSNVKARKLLKSGKAKIYQYEPIFTIQLENRYDGNVQPIEYCCDTGYVHIGVSIKSEKHEYVHNQYDLLPDEVENHKSCRRYRRTRRNRLRYRKKRFNNRKDNLVVKDGFAPSLRNKRDIHIALYKSFSKVMPITKLVFEVGQFDTQVLKAIEENKPIPTSSDYQHGEQYGYATLREAVFSRDNHTCQICGKGIKDNRILRMHHIGFWKGDRTNRIGNLLTVCTSCHTQKNHKKNGLLYGLEPNIKTFKGASFLNSVKYSMIEKLKLAFINTNIDIAITYGAQTKLSRRILNIDKTHANDAYCMGQYHPKHRCNGRYYKKRRRHNRVLEKFYDAKYIDIRDNSKKSGAELSCGRTNRSERRNSNKNERIYRGKKLSKGYRSIRKQRYAIQSGDTLMYKGRKYTSKGVHCNGTRVILAEINKSVKITDVKVKNHIKGWQEYFK